MTYNFINMGIDMYDNNDNFEDYDFNFEEGDNEEDNNENQINYLSSEDINELLYTLQKKEETIDNLNQYIYRLNKDWQILTYQIKKYEKIIKNQKQKIQDLEVYNKVDDYIDEFLRKYTKNLKLEDFKEFVTNNRYEDVKKREKDKFDQITSLLKNNPFYNNDKGEENNGKSTK